MIKAYATVFLTALAAVMSEAASAYVGPGAGLSLLGALWGLLVAVIAALAFIIVWPLRRMRRQRRATQRNASESRSGPDRDDSPAADEPGREASWER